jgi:ketosteroid isomerase-like protein
LDQREKLARAAYEAFNGRDLEAAEQLLATDVVWPDGLQGGTVSGRDAVLEHWQRLFAVVDAGRLEPVSFSGAGDPATLYVEVRQAVTRSSEPELRCFLHRFRFSGERISRLEVTELA